MALPANPNSSHGVFETLLVADGEPVELAAHLHRLGASVEQLYDQPPPPAAYDLIRDGARGVERGRIRLDARPEGGAIVLATKAVSVDPVILFPPRERGPELRSTTVGDWHGAHKWADRRLLDALEAGCAPAAPLLVDGHDGTVLETSRANLFAVRDDGTLATPPADGRILPGVARARVTELALATGVEVVEALLTLADLAAAREVFLTGSVRGIEPVRSIDATPTGDDSPGLTETLASELRRLWLGGHAPTPSSVPAS